MDDPCPPVATQIRWGLDYIQETYGRPPWHVRACARTASALLTCAVRLALRVSPPDAVTEARIRRGLAEAAATVDPDPGGLAAIRARTRKGEPWPSPQSQPSGPGSTHAPA